MKRIIEQIIGDFREFSFPEIKPRKQKLIALDGKVSTVIGMRRVGKTYFCFQDMLNHLANGVPRDRMLYVNFEDERLLPFGTSDFETLLNVYFALVPSTTTETSYFYFDEIQRIPGWELFIRRLLDRKRCRITITGSSSKLLSREIATSLRGRAITTEIFPISFEEYLNWVGIAEPQGPPYGTHARSTMIHALGQYMEIGGFPETLKLDAVLRRDILQGYLDIVVLRDIVERHSISNVPALRALLRRILHSPGGRFSINRFAGQLRSMGISVAKKALYDFVDHLNDAYLIYPVEIHARSIRKRQVNPKKMYAVDSGLLRAVSFYSNANRGAFLENLVYLALRRRRIFPDYYVTRNGLEVDFVYEHTAGEKEFIQVCWSLDDEETRNREIRALRDALAENKGAECCIVTWMDEGEIEGVKTIPAWKWLLSGGEII